MHDFHECLDASFAVARLPIWEEAYRQMWPNFEESYLNEEDNECQRRGIDRLLVNAGNTITVDEKFRMPTRCGGPWLYKDIMLEYVSNDRTGTAGWVEKELWCDYVAYAILQTGEIHLMRVTELQHAWQQNKSRWLQKFGTRGADNAGYCTLNCPVPVDLLPVRTLRVQPISFTQLQGKCKFIL